MKYLTLFFALVIMSFAPADTQKSAYQIFDKKGKLVTYEEMIKQTTEANVVLFGELHDNPIAHWLELEYTKDMHVAKNGKIMLGAEMFERDNQLLLNEYLDGLIEEKNFEDEAKIWPNYKTDYKPLVEFAKENKLGFVATNIPRRYASMVYHKGLESLDNLSDEAKKLLPPLPIYVNMDLPNYKALLDMAGDGHGGINFPHAQIVKDASMGYYISQSLRESGTFIHYNGAYHSDNFEGISWHIRQYTPEVNIKTISTVTQKDITELEKDNKKKADFIICVTESMTRTH